MQLHGIYTPVITPFDSRLNVDEQKFTNVLDFQLEHGIDGIIVGGSTGEFFALTPAERMRQFDLAAARIAGKAHFVAGVNDLRANDCYDLCRAARDAGADALLVGTPPYAQPSSRELAEHCRVIDRIAGLPLILYNYPGRAGAAMGDDFLAEACLIGNVIGIKESAGELQRIHALASRFPQLQLCAGAEDLVLEFFAWGARSWVSVIANFLPEEARLFHRTCVDEGDFATGREIMRALLPLMHILEHGGVFIQSVKAACESCGRPGGPVRPPLLGIAEEQQRDVARVVGVARDAVARIAAATN